jgi:hypothetical protein
MNRPVHPRHRRRPSSLAFEIAGRTAGALLLAAGLLKAWDSADLALSIYRYRILPYGAINALAILLPALEIVAGGSLVFGSRLRRGGALWSALLYAGFAAAVAVTLVRGLRIPCGCFGALFAGAPAGWPHVAVNLILAAFCLPMTRASAAPPRSGPAAGPPANES